MRKAFDLFCKGWNYCRSQQFLPIFSERFRGFCHSLRTNFNLVARRAKNMAPENIGGGIAHFSGSAVSAIIGCKRRIDAEKTGKCGKYIVGVVYKIIVFHEQRSVTEYAAIVSERL